MKTEKRVTFKKLILDDLKSQGLHSIASKIKSITYESFSMGDAVRVETLNLFKSERETLENLLYDYKYGTFDSMTDCSGIKENTANKARRAKYVTLNNKFTQDIKDDIKDLLRIDWDITDDATAKDKRGEWYDTLVWRELNKLNGDHRESA